MIQRSEELYLIVIRPACHLHHIQIVSPFILFVVDWCECCAGGGGRERERCGVFYLSLCLHILELHRTVFKFRLEIQTCYAQRERERIRGIK